MNLLLHAKVNSYTSVIISHDYYTNEYSNVSDYYTNDFSNVIDYFVNYFSNVIDYFVNYFSNVTQMISLFTLILFSVVRKCFWPFNLIFSVSD